MGHSADMDPRRGPEPHSLAWATDAARTRARQQGEACYVLERVLPVPAPPSSRDRAGPSQPHAVSFAPCSPGELARLLDSGGPALNQTLTVLRVARPDGTVAPVDDPREKAARRAQFCAEVPGT